MFHEALSLSFTNTGLPFSVLIQPVRLMALSFSAALASFFSALATFLSCLSCLPALPLSVWATSAIEVVSRNANNSVSTRFIQYSPIAWFSELETEVAYVFIRCRLQVPCWPGKTAFSNVVPGDGNKSYR